MGVSAVPEGGCVQWQSFHQEKSPYLVQKDEARDGQEAMCKLEKGILGGMAYTPYL